MTDTKQRWPDGRMHVFERPPIFVLSQDLNQSSIVYFDMRYFRLFWRIAMIFNVLGNEQIEHVSGMPLHLSEAGGSKRVNVLDFQKQRSRVGYKILFRNKTSFVANGSNCGLEVWTGGSKISRQARSQPIPSWEPRKIEVLLETENPELYKIYVDKSDQARFPSLVDFIAKIFCRKRKFSACIHFLAERGTSHSQRRLLSVDQLYIYRDPKDDIPLQPIIFLIAGLMILVIAGSLCTPCTKHTYDDESLSENRPQLVSIQERSSIHHKTNPQHQSFQEEIAIEVKDNHFVETVEKIEGDAVDGSNHISVYEPTVSVKPLSEESVHNLAPDRSQDHVVQQQHVLTNVDRVTEADQKSEKKKRGSKNEQDHEEHKGKFWKRSRGSKHDHRNSDGVFKDDEHKYHDRRSRKESKEAKVKSGKSKDRKGSTDSDEQKALDEESCERPKEAVLTLERHARGLPAPPPPPLHSPVHLLPVRPMSHRQLSDPCATASEDANYETVEIRKAKSAETLEFSSDDNYDNVRFEAEKRRLPVSMYDSIRVEESWSLKDSDLYEIVENTSLSTKEDLYAEVPGDEEEPALCEDADEDESEDPEDPYSKIKQLRAKEVLENSEPYEEIVNRAANVLPDFDVSVDFRRRAKSDTFGLKRTGNEFIIRSNTIDVVRPRAGEVSPSVEDLYAKVDLSKKTRRAPNTEKGTREEEWSDDNPPPLPPVYISSKQIQVEMLQLEGNVDGLYDEVEIGASEHQRPQKMELSVPDETKRFSTASDHYELVEVKHNVAIMDDNYAGLVDEGPRSSTDGYRSARSEHLETASALVNHSCVDVDNGSESEEPQYELVTPRDKSSNSSNIILL